jgi:hypothetical protein
MVVWVKVVGWGRHPLSVVNHRVFALIVSVGGHLYLYVLGFGAYMFNCWGVLVV